MPVGKLWVVEGGGGGLKHKKLSTTFSLKTMVIESWTLKWLIRKQQYRNGEYTKDNALYLELLA